jgi:hypothetical protein
MFWNKTKMVAAVVILAAVVLAGAGAGTVQIMALGGVQQKADQAKVVLPAAPGNQEKATPSTQVPQPKEDKRIKQLTAALVVAGQDQWVARWGEYAGGRTTVDFVLTASDKLLEADLKAATTGDERITAYETHLLRMRWAESVAKAKFEAGAVPASGYYQVLYGRLEAEIMGDKAWREKSAPQEVIQATKKRIAAEWPQRQITVAADRFAASVKDYAAGKAGFIPVIQAEYAWLTTVDLASAHTKVDLSVYTTHLAKSEEALAIIAQKEPPNVAHSVEQFRHYTDELKEKIKRLQGGK